MPKHCAVRQPFGTGAALGPEQATLRMLDAELDRAAARMHGQAQQCAMQAWQVLRVDVDQRLGGVLQQPLRLDAVQLAGAFAGVEKRIAAIGEALELEHHAR